MKKLREAENIEGLANCLRQDLVKNVANISTSELYNRCYYGTKRSIEKYHNEVIKCIKTIYYADDNKITQKNKLRFFAETRHSYGHTALMLSGGASFGKFHLGLIKALYEQDLMPRIITGASAGSLLALAICTRPYERMHEVFTYETVFPSPIVKWLHSTPL